MLHVPYRKNVSLLGFALAVAVLAVVIVAYSVFDYRRMRSRMEQSLVREGLKVIEAFEASVRAGLTGRRVWDAEKLRALVKDTCKRADLEYFSFVDPSLRVFCVTRDSEGHYRDPALTNLYALLAHQRYDWRYVTNGAGKKAMCVIKPLLLDNAERIGRRTFRFYQVLLDRRNQKKLMRELRPCRKNTHALPLAMVGLPLDDIRALTGRTIFQSITIGITFFLLGTALIYVAVVVQQHGLIGQALAEARADNERLLKSLRRSDRLAILGRMAAMMAHELRNPLSSVRGFTQLFRKKLETANDTQMCNYADLVINEVDRLNAVITGMLDFSRPVEPQFQRRAFKPFVERAFRLIKRDADARNVALVSLIPDSLPEVPVDENLVNQVLLNLFINALDAMPGGGELAVEASATKNGVVHIQVRDTGKGIPREHLKQIFEPFYSTKPTGTGLGLAAVDNIVAEHSGNIWVESELGKGCVFHIEIPIATKDEIQ